MRNRIVRRLIVTLLFLVLASILSSAQDKAPMWSSGNAFLRACDASSPIWIGSNWRANDRSMWLMNCDTWVTGVRQGMEVLQQMRPPEQLSPEKKKAEEAQERELEKEGIKPMLSMPNKNVCIPENVTNEQLRFVVIKWMKDHPEALAQHAAFLTVAAITSTYPCQ